MIGIQLCNLISKTANQLGLYKIKNNIHVYTNYATHSCFLFSNELNNIPAPHMIRTNFTN